MNRKYPYKTQFVAQKRQATLSVTVNGQPLADVLLATTARPAVAAALPQRQRKSRRRAGNALHFQNSMTGDDILHAIRSLLVVMALAFMASLLASSQAQAQQSNQARRGLSVAKMACAHCHAIQKASRRSPVAAAPRFVDIANSPGMTATAIIAALETTPHLKMPTWRINSEARNDLVAYILSLKRK